MEYLKSIHRLFNYYKQIGEKAMAQVSDEDLFKQENMEVNSIAIIIQHLSGNMMSRWTDFLTTDGEKDWRKRDEEFEKITQTRQEVIAIWEKGWACLFNALTSIREEDLNKIIYIRNEGQTVMDAINRQLAHYPYHVGQIVHIAKQHTTNTWISLSIPRKESENFNSKKFIQDKQIKSFTDDLLNEKI
jgi:Protein of unknown function (DUF1572)